MNEASPFPFTLTINQLIRKSAPFPFSSGADQPRGIALYFGYVAVLNSLFQCRESLASGSPFRW